MGRYRGLRAISALAALALAAGAVLAGTVTYTYDARGRVVSATYANGLTTGYVYDAAGNRTQVATAAPPVANPVALGVIVNTTANPVPLSVSGAYTSVGVATGATHGTATSSGTSITYSPGSGYTGPDSFTYQATNSSGTSAPAGVLVAVAPAAGAVGLTVAYNSASNPVPLSITGAYASVALASFASHGAAILSGTSINYTPATGYIGGDSFLYSASNAVATSAPATVTVTVNPPPPIANPVSASVVNDTTNNHILTNITGGTPTSVAVSTPASHGTATPSGSTSYVYYTPNSGYSGPDSFAYTASNAGGTSSPATATITVTGLTAVASTTLNCPTGAPTYVCITSTTNSYTFTGHTLSLTITGGSGSYTYVWMASGIVGGTWPTGQTTATVTPSVTGITIENSGQANYSCTVTDTVTGLHATSNAITYEYYRS